MILTLLLFCLQDASIPAQRWREDLATFQKEFTSRHIQPYAKLSEADFNAELAAINPDKLSDQQIVLSLWKLMAKVGDSHSRVIEPPGRQFFTRYPLGIGYLTDGWYVVAIDSREKRHLRGKLTKVNLYPIKEVCTKLETLIAAENDSQRQNQLPQLLTMPEALEFCGILEKAGPADFTIQSPEGNETHVTLWPDSIRPAEISPAIDWKSWPKHLQFNRAPYGHQHLDKENALYVWYDRCANDPRKSVKDWTAEVVKLLDEKKPDKVIVDLRRNGGGNSSLLEPLIRELKDREVNTRARLKVLIGPATFSSAMMNAQQFATRTQAELLGQPTGGSPNHFGEVKRFQLPHSKCTVMYSTKKFVMTKDNATTVIPHRIITPTAKGFFADRDEALEAALLPQ